MLNSYAISLVTLWNWPIVGIEEVKRLGPVSIAASLVNIGLSLALVRRLGIAGPLVGTLVSYLLTHFVVVPRLLRELFGLSPTALLAKTIRPIIPGLLLFAVINAAAVVPKIQACG